jgi:hypothetical protein
MERVVVKSAREFVSLIRRALSEEVDIVAESEFETVWFTVRRAPSCEVALTKWVQEPGKTTKRMEIDRARMSLQRNQYIVLHEFVEISVDGMRVAIDFPVRIKSERKYAWVTVKLSKHVE